MELMAAAQDVLPLFRQKPHLLVVTIPVAAYPACMAHPNAQHFIFLTMEAWSDLPHWTEAMTRQSVAMPMFGHIHWPSGWSSHVHAEFSLCLAWFTESVLQCMAALLRHMHGSNNGHHCGPLTCTACEGQSLVWLIGNTTAQYRRQQRVSN